MKPERWIALGWLVLVDAPAFVIKTWLRMYTLVLAAGSLILWGMLIWWLARFAWREIAWRW